MASLGKHYGERTYRPPILHGNKVAYPVTQLSMHTVRAYLKRLADPSKPVRHANRDDIDDTTIGIYITDNLNRSIRDLAAQIAFEMKFPFDEVLDLLNGLEELGYFTPSLDVRGTISTIFHLWKPGEDETYYETFMQFIRRINASGKRQ